MPRMAYGGQHPRGNFNKQEVVMKKLYSVLAASSLVLLTAGLFAAPYPAYAAQKPGGKVEKSEPKVVKDPVCDMDVETKGAKWVYEYKGQKYYFCMKGDMEAFKKDPEKYIRKGGK